MTLKMKFIVWLAVHSFLGVQSMEPRSFNVDIEATMVLQPKDLQNTFVEKLRRMLSLMDGSVQTAHYRSTHGVITNFLNNVVDIIKTYNEAEMYEVLQAVNGLAVQTASIDNRVVRLFMKNNILRWSKYQPLELKKEIITFSNNASIQYLASNFDKFYDESDKTRLDGVLTMLKAQSALEVPIKDIFINIFDVCFFDKYKSLIASEKREFETEMLKLRAIILNVKDKGRSVLVEINEKMNRNNEIVFKNQATLQVRGDTDNVTEAH